LQLFFKVQHYVYVDIDDVARQVAKHHSRGLRDRFPELLTTTAFISAFSSLTGDISLISEKDLHWLGHVDLVIAGWPCQGMSMAGNQNGLQDGRSSRFYNMVRVIRYLQTSQRRPPGYIVENVPIVSSSRSRTLESTHKIHSILGVPVLIGAAVVGSRAHRPRFWWTNLAPAELMQSAISRTRRPDVYVSDILDPHRTPRRIYHDDQAPLAVVNRKGEPRRAFPTLVSFARSYAFKDNGLGLVWDSITQEMVEPNTDECERAMGFSTGTTNVHGISEQQRRFLLGQAMDLNCLTWVVSLVVAEQRRLASTLIGQMGFYELRSAMESPHLVTRPRKMVGGERASIAHPWNLWGVERVFTQDKAEVPQTGMEWQGQSSELVRPRIDLEEYVEQRFFEEHTAYQMKEIWKLRHMEPGLFGMVGLEEEEPPSPGIQ
jgi:hypothetical protein